MKKISTHTFNKNIQFKTLQKLIRFLTPPEQNLQCMLLKMTVLYRRMIYHTTFYYTVIAVISGVVRQWSSGFRPGGSFGGVENTRL